MPELKDALASLRPIDYADVPTSHLSSFLKTAFSNAEIIINSIPPSSSSSTDPTSHPSPNSARKATDTVASGSPTAIDDRNASLQKSWGKPYKINEKENPLHVAVYKMSGHDKHGAWFARRSIHQGLGFEKWKHAMQKEFAESSKVKGGPGAGAIRGIGADRRVKHEAVEGVGELAVWQLSAIFGPVTPREFLMLVMTSDNALSNASALDDTSGKPPRHFMVVSRPTKHEDVPDREKMVKGQYESIEMIRELPSTGKEDDPEGNPIEWMMITRSDPGGGIPKFMIERGTPGSVVGDTVKFLDWACKQDDSADEDETKKVEESEMSKSDSPSQVNHAPPTYENQNSPPVVTRDRAATTASVENGATIEDEPVASSGILASVANAAAYVGTTASSYIPGFQSQEDVADEEDDAVSVSSSSSDETFRSADEGDTSSVPSSPRVVQYQQTVIQGRHRNISAVSDAPSVASSNTSRHSITASLVNGREPQNHHEKELLKIHSKRAQLDEKAAKARQSEEIKAKAFEESEEQNATKAKEKFEKEKQKREEKHEKEVKKLEEKRLKEERKAEEKRKKALDKDELTKTKRERDEARERCASAEEEIALLQKQIDELRHEHAALLAKVEAANGANGDVLVPA